jgi:hypothetical protein
MNITPERKRAFWFIAIGLAVVYYTPAILTRVMESDERQPAKAQGAPTARQVQATLPAPPAPFRGLLGQYSGRATVPALGICSLQFELRDNREKIGFAGYSTLTCVYPYAWRRSPYAHAVAPRPTSAILSGVAEDGLIRFNAVDKVAGRCAPRTYAVKPFGNNQIVAQWKDSTCGGGSMVLSRTGR